MIEIVLAGAGVLVVLVVGVLVRRWVRGRAAAERAVLEDGLRRSQEQVAALARRVEDLSAEVQSARRANVEDHEYVITTLAEATLSTSTGAEVPAERAAPLDVEQRIVDGLGRVDDRSVLGGRLVETAVSLMATAHGVRRALRPEHLDRAAAESHVARRRSRRLRRQELREAKRLLRAVKAQRPVRLDDSEGGAAA